MQLSCLPARMSAATFCGPDCFANWSPWIVATRLGSNLSLFKDQNRFVYQLSIVTINGDMQTFTVLPWTRTGRTEQRVQVYVTTWHINHQLHGSFPNDNQGPYVPVRINAGLAALRTTEANMVVNRVVATRKELQEAKATQRTKNLRARPLNGATATCRWGMMMRWCGWTTTNTMMPRGCAQKSFFGAGLRIYNPSGLRPVFGLCCTPILPRILGGGSCCVARCVLVWKHTMATNRLSRYCGTGSRVFSCFLGVRLLLFSSTELWTSTKLLIVVLDRGLKRQVQCQIHRLMPPLAR